MSLGEFQHQKKKMNSLTNEFQEDAVKKIKNESSEFIYMLLELIVWKSKQ